MNLVNHTYSHPIGTLVPVHQKYATPKIQIATDTGLMDADGRFLAPAYFPELFRAIGYRHGRGHRDMFKLPNMTAQLHAESIRLTPAQMPLHSHASVQSMPSPHAHTIVGFDPAFGNHTHGYFVTAESGVDLRTIYKKQKLDRSDIIGTIDEVTNDPFGVQVKMHFNAYTDTIKNLQEFCATPPVSPNDVRRSLGLSEMDLFPEMHGIKGMKWGVKRSSGRYPFSNSNLKENNMANATVKLKTPAKNIKRKDLSVALRLSHLGRNEDALFDVIALVQSVGDDEKIYRVNELKGSDQVVGKNVRVHNTSASGVCSDFVVDEYSGAQHFVIAGKLEKVDGADFVIVSEIPETESPLGNDTLRMVQD